LVNVKKKTFGLIKYANGSISYIQPTHGFFLGDYSFTTSTPKRFWANNNPGITVLLCFLKKLTIIHNVFLKNKPTFSKSNGTFCQIIEIYDDCSLITILLPSGDYKILLKDNFATLGRCYNYMFNYSNFGKAGNLKIIGHKPKVRGVAKNPVDNPHGGRTKTNKPEVSPWGWVAKHNK
jgi:large subunit ribosomal protein L2